MEYLALVFIGLLMIVSLVMVVPDHFSKGYMKAWRFLHSFFTGTAVDKDS